MQRPTSMRFAMLALAALTTVATAAQNPTAPLPQPGSPTSAFAATTSATTTSASTASSTTAAPSAMTLLQLCPELPHGELTSEQFSAYERCTKEAGPARIAKHYADIYQKTAGHSRLTYQDGSALEFDDVPEDNPSTNQSFSLWGCDESKRYCVIYLTGWEWFGYSLIDRHTKQQTELTGAPLFSPDSSLLFEYLDSRISEHDSENIVKLYRIHNGRLELLLDQSNGELGVHSANWTGPQTLTANMQNFDPLRNPPYLPSGSMQVTVNGPNVKVEVTPAAK